MPKIHLKPHSPEFADSDDDNKSTIRNCDMPGCSLEAEHKAPKDRSLKEHYWFCFDHVQEYNKAWDFFSGMSQQDIEDHIIRSALWDRPTRRFDNYANMEEHLRQTAWKTYGFSGAEKNDQQQNDKEQKNYEAPLSSDAPEFEAMAVMGLAPPLDIDVIKKRYKELAKKYHPDINKDDPKAEELLKRINMAYTILKLAHEKYAKLPEEKK
jgi:DnaJ-domain-containing protein 1